MMAVQAGQGMGRTVKTVMVAMLFLVMCGPAWPAEKPPSAAAGKTAPAVSGRNAAVNPSTTGKNGIPLNVSSGAPLNIAGDRMEASQKDREIIFEGHVVVQQGDLTITGKALRVIAVPGDKPGQDSMMDKIDRIEIEGEVRISQREKLATAEKAVYYHQENKIVLMGNPTVSQGQDKLMGRLITLYIKEGRSVVEGGESTPVQAVLHPAGKD